MYRSFLPLLVAGAVACATSPAGQDEEVFAHAELVSGSPEEGTAGYALRGVQIPPRLPADDGAALREVVKAVDALTAQCPDFGARLMWLDCGESPCHAYLWRSGRRSAPPGAT